jgi:FixJ family two-component response regulator
LADPAPTVHVVDDDASFRKAVSRLLSASGYRVETYTSGTAFLNRPPADSPGCLITDLKMPEMSGLEFQQALAQLGIGLPIVFLTGYGDVATSVQAMRRGAEDFLQKTAPREHLLEAVRRAIERDERERGERRRIRDLRAIFEALTHREREVLDQVVRGKLNKQIAGELMISERSVKRHRSAIMDKLRVQSVAELIRLVQEAGLIVGGQFALAR